MNRIIFQLGLLAFFVACVLFAIEGFTIFAAIGRAFIVFIAVILAGAALLVVTSWVAVVARQHVDEAEDESAAPSPEKGKG